VTVVPLVNEPLVTETPPWVPSRDMKVILRDLTEALRELRARRGDVDTFWNYYDGEHEQIWYSDSLRKAFGGKGMNDLQDNYCALVVNAPLSRCAVRGWEPRRPQPKREAPAAQQTVDQEGHPVAQLAEVGDTEEPVDQAVVDAEAQWDDQDMDLELDDALRGMLIAGRSFVHVWPKFGPDGNTQERTESGALAFDLIVKDARNVYVARGAKTRSRKWSAQITLERDRWRATLMYSDLDGLPAEVVRLHTPPADKVANTFPQQVGRFVLDADDPGGPMPEVFNGQCPMVPFQLDARGRSWLRDAVPGQDKINKLSANKMVCAEFLAFPQRYILTDQEIKEGTLRYSPAKVLQLSPGGAVDEGTGEVVGKTQVGEFTAADLEIYDKSHQREVEKLFTIKQLPKHLMVNPGTDPSGDAIKADEGPFVSFVRLVHRMAGASLTDVQQLMGNDVKPVWADPEVHNEETNSRAFLNYRQGDVPLGPALRHIGWTDEEITAAVREELIARKAAAAQAAAAAERAALMFDQGRDDNADGAASTGATEGNA
jgi:hypothetical protein